MVDIIYIITKKEENKYINPEKMDTATLMLIIKNKTKMYLVKTIESDLKCTQIITLKTLQN